MPDSPKRILIVKLSSLGDILHALPAPGLLHRDFPEAKIAWAVEEKWLPLIERHPQVDEIFTLDTLGLRRQPLRWGELGRGLQRLRAFRADTALDLQGTVKSAVVTRYSGARRRIGMAHPYRRERGAWFGCNERMQPASTHVVEQLLDLAGSVSGRGRGDYVPEFPFPIPADVQASVDGWLETQRLQEFAFFSPGGGWASKRWPLERYAAVAGLLRQAMGLEAVVNQGAAPGGAPVWAREFVGDVVHLGAILKRARLVIGGDTGPMHVAAAVGTPTVALFGPTDPERNRPFSDRGIVIYQGNPSSCAHGRFVRGKTVAASMLAITPEEVALACKQAMEMPARGGTA